MIISRKKLAHAKVEKLQKGYSAYAETAEVARFIQRELQQMDLPVHIDRTPQGYWFIPERKPVI
jgi:hypothetical protein